MILPCDDSYAHLPDGSYEASPISSSGLQPEYRFRSLLVASTPSVNSPFIGKQDVGLSTTLRIFASPPGLRRVGKLMPPRPPAGGCAASMPQEKRASMPAADDDDDARRPAHADDDGSRGAGGSSSPREYPLCGGSTRHYSLPPPAPLPHAADDDDDGRGGPLPPSTPSPPPKGLDCRLSDRFTSTALGSNSLVACDPRAVSLRVLRRFSL